MDRSVDTATDTSNMHGILRPLNIEKNQDVTGEMGVYHVNNAPAFFTYNII
jgi:hypothetical protein